MKTDKILQSAAVLAAVIVIAAAATTRGATSTASPAPALEQIKKLAGEWEGTAKNGKGVDKVRWSFEVTAGGNTVLETLFKGSDHEMVTMYHQDGDDLVLTHYCVLGNEPRMRARRDTSHGRIVFECAGGSNMKSENDKHMHQGTITWLDDGRINTEWLQYENGKQIYTASYDLTRSK